MKKNKEKKKMNKGLKISLITIGSIVGALVLAVGSYVGYVLGSFYRIEDNQVLEVNKPSVELGKVNTNVEYKISTYNIGFGSYSQDYSFFMDEGYMADGTPCKGTESRGWSKEEVLKNTQGATRVIQDYAPDFAFFQEVDVKADRSYKVDQRHMLNTAFGSYTNVYAENFHAPFLFYPILKPHGAVQAGIMTYSKYDVNNSVRKSFTITDNMIGKCMDLDRCFSASYLPISGSDKQLVLVNFHMSAYDEGGVIRAQQMKELNEFLTAEEAKGNYIVAGGDSNHDLLTNNPDFDYTKENIPFKNQIQQLKPDWLQFFHSDNKDSPLADSFKLIASDNTPTCRDASMVWDDTYSYVTTIDGFIVSSNVEVITHENIKTHGDKVDGFAFSDHDPATMTFKLL